jgi:hypothetical protein
VSTTEQATAYWTHQRPGGVERMKWLQHYWDSWNAPHRRHILQALQLVRDSGPVDSVAEVGCHAGPNLRLIAGTWLNSPRHDQFVTPELYGLDINAEALEFGRAKADADGWGEHVQFIEGSALEVEMKLPRVDLIFSCYALAYLDPKDLWMAIAQMASRAKRALMFLEPSTMWQGGPGICGDGPEWRHDYNPLGLSILFPVERITIWRIRPEADRLDTAVLIELPTPPPPTGEPIDG